MNVADATKAYMAWEAFAAKKGGQPDQLAMAADFTPSSKGTVSVSFSGNWYGTVKEANAVLGPLVKSLGSETTLTTKPLDWIGGLVEVAGNGDSLDTSKPDGVSIFIYCPCSDAEFLQNDTFFTKAGGMLIYLSATNRFYSLL